MNDQQKLISQLTSILDNAAKDAGMQLKGFCPDLPSRVKSVRDYLGDLLNQGEHLNTDAETVAENMDRVDTEIRDLSSEIREIGGACLSDAESYISEAENTCDHIDVDYREAQRLQSSISELVDGLNVLYGRLDDLVASLPPVSDEETPNAANPQTEEVQA